MPAGQQTDSVQVHFCFCASTSHPVIIAESRPPSSSSKIEFLPHIHSTDKGKGKQAKSSDLNRSANYQAQWAAQRTAISRDSGLIQSVNQSQTRSLPEERMS
jgi:hypothetical protein